MQENERSLDALSALLVVADFADKRERHGFLSRIEAAAAASVGDPVLSALAAELSVIIGQIDSGEMTPAGGANLASQLFAAAAAAARTQPEATSATRGQENVYVADPAVVADFIGGAEEQLEAAEKLLSAAAMGQAVDVHALFRCMHTLKGMSGFLSLDDLARESHAAEAVLDEVRTSDRQMSEREVEGALASVDRMRSMVSGLSAAHQPGSKAAVDRRRIQHVRVDAARLEGLLDAMGELAVAEAELAEAVQRSQDADSIRCLERLQRIGREMQGTATALRMVTLRQTFSKMTRVVRDGLALSGKTAELDVSGEDTEIDRTIVEGLGDPLVHLLRNAIDHGIESNDERTAAGKPSAGRLSLRAFHRSGSVYIEIEDDGRGIDPDHLVRRANERGIDFDREHPLSLIFRPGFSTADRVTELSGRGVGMDAVASAVSALHGQLDVSSEPGRGTRFTIRLPLTLAIIDGIVLRASSERYVIPTHFVERTVGLSRSDIVSAAGTGDILVLAEGPVPVLPTTLLLGGELESGDVAVILADGDDRFAVVVDEVIGQQSLVIKPLTGPTAAAAGPAGAALMGDGAVALVIDPAGLARAMRRGGEGARPRIGP